MCAAKHVQLNDHSHMHHSLLDLSQVGDSERTKDPAEFVQLLLDERDKYEAIISKAFADDKTFRNSLNQVRGVVTNSLCNICTEHLHGQYCLAAPCQRHFCACKVHEVIKFIFVLQTIIKHTTCSEHIALLRRESRTVIADKHRKSAAIHSAGYQCHLLTLYHCQPACHRVLPGL